MTRWAACVFLCRLVFVGTLVIAPASGAESCLDVRISACDATLDRASKRCDRYHIEGTEARPICHRSAREARDRCAERAGGECASNKTKPPPAQPPKQQ